MRFMMKDLPDGFELPKPSTGNRRGGGLRKRFDVHLKTVTPIFGGAARTRTCDEVDVVRVPTIRGHLRFWWRALHAHRFSNSGALYGEEARIWGRAGDAAGGGRSSVEVRVKVLKKSGLENQNPGARSAYALWPARPTQQGQPAAPRRRPGLEFKLFISAPSADLEQVRGAVRLWILFGGYGSRTRRGLGALTVCDAAENWLPDGSNGDNGECLLQSLDDLFKSSLCGRNQGPAGRIFSVPSAPAGWAPNSVPVIAGASFLVKLPAQANDETDSETDSNAAWLAALHRLRDFRQGDPNNNGNPARNGNYGRSFWPEADVLRSLTRKYPARHTPRSEHTPPPPDRPPLWPRAGFGLPIQLQFAPGDRAKEPPSVQLLWGDGEGTEHDRLASPLIVKPLPVRDGSFLPMALWLNRASPEGSQVFAKEADEDKKVVAKSRAPMDHFDAPLFSPASTKSSLRQAFCDWLVAEHNWKKLP